MFSDWTHTAHILCLIANVNRDTKKHREPYSVSDFHPMMKKAPPLKAPIDVLKVFVKEERDAKRSGGSNKSGTSLR